MLWLLVGSQGLFGFPCSTTYTRSWEGAKPGQLTQDGQSVRSKTAKTDRSIPFETYLAQDSELLNQKMGTLCLASSTFSRNNDTLHRTKAWLWAHYISLSLAKDRIKTTHLYLIRVVCHHGLITYVSNSKNMRRVGSPFGSNIQFGMLSVRKIKTLSVLLSIFL